jgi:hypothetical protein
LIRDAFSASLLLVGSTAAEVDAEFACSLALGPPEAALGASPRTPHPNIDTAVTIDARKRQWTQQRLLVILVLLQHSRFASVLSLDLAVRQLVLFKPTIVAALYACFALNYAGRAQVSIPGIGPSAWNRIRLRGF